MQTSRPLVLALLLLATGCTAIVDAGSYEVLAEGGSNVPDTGAPDADTGVPDARMPDADTGTAGRGPEPDAGPIDEDGSVDETPVEIDWAKFEATVTALATWACVNVSRCESRLGGEAQRVRALAFCHPEAVQRVHLAALRASAEDGTIGFDPAKADACLAALSASDAVDCRADILAPTVEACAGVFEGKVAADGACGTDLQCVPGLVCAGNDVGCAGSCKVPGRQGGACTETGDCESAFVCLDSQCVARARAGLPCRTDGECLDERYCDIAAGAQMGRCAMQGAEEAACSGNHSCLPDLLCVKGEAAADPSTCGSGVELGGNCSADRPCALRARCASGKCVLVARPGASCNSDAQCPFGMFCGSDGCEPKPLLDQECDESSTARPRRECIEGVCIDGTCTLGGEAAVCRFEPGSPFPACEGYCTPSSMCASSTKSAGRACDADYECAEDLLCLADDPEAPTERTCNRPQCE